MTSEQWVMVGAAVVAAVAMAACYFTWTRYLRVKKLPVTPLNEVRHGLTRVSGKLVAMGEPLISPFGAEPCLMYDFRVEEKRTRSSKNGTRTYWVTVIKDVRKAPVLLEDATTVLELDWDRANFSVAQDYTTRSGMFDQAGAHEVEVLARYGKKSRNWLFEKTLRYTESFLKAGETVHVLADVQDVAGAKRLTKGQGFPMLITDQEPEKLSQHFLWQALAATLVEAVATGVLAWSLAGGFN